jgi:hypothetical protein
VEDHIEGEELVGDKGFDGIVLRDIDCLECFD